MELILRVQRIDADSANGRIMTSYMIMSAMNHEIEERLILIVMLDAKQFVDRGFQMLAGCL